MKHSTTTPILRIFDIGKAKEHYLSFLGFQMDWEHRFGEGFPLYFQISKDDCVIHLSEHYGDACPGASVRIKTEGLREYHRFLSQQNYPYARPGIEAMPWGTDDLTVTDPFGNRLTFWEPAGAEKADGA